jgi:hypothetical protein
VYDGLEELPRSTFATSADMAVQVGFDNAMPLLAYLREATQGLKVCVPIVVFGHEMRDDHDNDFIRKVRHCRIKVTGEELE